MILDFFHTLYGDVENGELESYRLVIWRKGDKRSEWHGLLNEDKITASIDKDPNDVYFGVCLQSPTLIQARTTKTIEWQRVRGTADTATLIPAFWMDIDTSCGVHAETNLPSIEEALAFLRSPENPFGAPTTIVHSGGGLHCYWQFKEPWILDSDDEREKATLVSRLFQVTLIEAGKKKGWNFDNTADLARILRVPGTYNMKGPEPKLVEILETNPGIRYNVADFEPYFVDIEYAEPSYQKDYSQGEFNGPLPDFEQICTACAWSNHCVKDAATLPEPEWHASLGVIARCEDGRELAHKISEPYRGYSVKETDMKIDHVLKGPGPRTCAAIRQIPSAAEYCVDCPHEVKSPIVLGYRRSAKFTKDKALEQLKKLEDLASENADTCIRKAIETKEVLEALHFLRIKDIPTFQALLMRLRELRVKVRDIDALQRVLKDFKPPKGTDEEFEPRSELIEKYLPDVPVKGLVQPGSFFMVPGQTATRTYDEEAGRYRYHVIANAPFLIAGRFIAEDGEQVLNIAWKRKKQKNWQTASIGRGDALNNRSLQQLAPQGFPVNSNNAADLVNVVEEFETVNYDLIPTCRVSGRMGWQRSGDVRGFLCGKSFIVGGTGEIISPLPSLDEALHCAYGKFILFYPEQGTPDLSKTLTASGDFEIWQNVIATISEFPSVMILLYAALVPPLLEVLGLPNFVVDLSGVTSTGKTTALMVAASVWGNPDTRSSHSLIGNWDSTRVFIERRSAIFNGLPFILDDTKQAKYPADVGKIIYDISSGQSRGRGSKTGIQQMKTTRTVLITSGEAPAVSFTQDGGTRARTITLWGQPFGETTVTTGTLVNELRDGILENYGHLGPRFVSEIVKRSAEHGAWKQRLKQIRQSYQERLGGNPLASRLSEYWAIISLVGELVHEWRLLPWEFTCPIEKLWDKLASETEGADRATAALEYVLSWTNAHRSEFYWQQKTGGERQYCSSPAMGWAGRWDKEESATPAFFPHKLKEILFEGGFEPDAILRTWGDRGWTYRDSNGRNQRQVRVDGRNCRLIELTREAMIATDAESELPPFMRLVQG